MVAPSAGATTSEKPMDESKTKEEYATISIERVVCVVCQRRVGFVATVRREGKAVGHIEHGEIGDLLAVSAALLGSASSLPTSSP